jgi:hypothetical protein
MPARDHQPTLRSLRIALVIILATTNLHATPPAAGGEGSGDTGLVVSVSGEVRVHRPGGSESATEGFVLLAGDTINVRAGGICSGFVPSGASFQLQGPSQFVLEGADDQGLLDGVATWIQRQLSHWIGESRSQPLTTRTRRDWKLRSETPRPLIP